MGDLSKLLIKIYSDKTEHVEWRHLCYIAKELFDSYREKRPEELGNMNMTLSRWAKEDFNKDLTITSQAELDLLKIYVKDYCRETYPDIYLDQSTDRQGWLRVWVSKKMKEDLENDGK